MSRTLIFAMVFSFVLVVFALQNVDVVDIDLYFWHYESSLAIVVLVSFGIGALVGILFSIPSYLRKNRELKELREKFLNESSRSNQSSSNKDTSDSTATKEIQTGKKGMGSF